MNKPIEVNEIIFVPDDYTPHILHVGREQSALVGHDGGKPIASNPRDVEIELHKYVTVKDHLVGRIGYSKELKILAIQRYRTDKTGISRINIKDF